METVPGVNMVKRWGVENNELNRYTWIRYRASQ